MFPSTGRAKSLPKLLTLTLEVLSQVSWRFSPVRLLLLCWVGTDTWAAAQDAISRIPADRMLSRFMRMELGVSYSLQTRFRRGNCPLPYNTGTATQQNLFTAWARILRQAKRPEMGVRAKAAPRKACT